MQVFEARLESLPVVLPGHAIHARRSFPLQRLVSPSERVDVDMVQERGEPLLLLQPRGLPYAVEAVGRAFPARCPERAALIRVLLGPRPWLHRLLGRSPGFVRRLHGYYGGT